MPRRKDKKILPVSKWEKWFLDIWDKEHKKFFKNWSKSNDSFWYYFLAYGIDGNTAMYEATGDTKYLDRALDYVKNVVDDAEVSSLIPENESNKKDKYKGWICRLTNIEKPTKGELAVKNKEI